MEVAIIAKSGGPLTKRISLAADGSLKSDGSACVMSRGTAKRFTFAGVGQFATLIEHFAPHQAIILGGLRRDLPNEVRTSDYFVFRPGEPALALVDYDTKGMPPGVAERIKKLGGLLPALASVLPGLASAARVERGSTSAGLYRTDTGAKLAGSSATVELPIELKLVDCPIFVGPNGPRAALPSKPVLDCEGRQARPSGKPQFAPVVEWRNRGLADRFSATVIGLVEGAHPDMLSGRTP